MVPALSSWRGSLLVPRVPAPGCCEALLCAQKETLSWSSLDAGQRPDPGLCIHQGCGTASLQGLSHQEKTGTPITGAHDPHQGLLEALQKPVMPVLGEQCFAIFSVRNVQATWRRGLRLRVGPALAGPCLGDWAPVSAASPGVGDRGKPQCLPGLGSTNAQFQSNPHKRWLGDKASGEWRLMPLASSSVL